MHRILGPEDPWATWPQRAGRKIVQYAAYISATAILLVIAALATFGVNEYRLGAIEREYCAVAQNLVTQRATRTEVWSTLSSLRGAEVTDETAGVLESAMFAKDPSAFTVFLETAYIQAVVDFDTTGRAKAYRVVRIGTTLSCGSADFSPHLDSGL